jgi:betaine-homocysteine S-methyltransferase
VAISSSWNARGYVDSGSGKERLGLGGQRPIHVENPDALRALHQNSSYRLAGFAGAHLLRNPRKLTRAGYGEQTEAINAAAVRIAREVAAGKALVAGSVSRTQLFEREGPSASQHVRDLLSEQIRLLKHAGVDFLILETFFRLDEMLVALACARESGLPAVATMSFRPVTTQSSDGHSVAVCAQRMMEAGAGIVGANCEQEPKRMLSILRSMREAVTIPVAAQPAAFLTTDNTPCFTKMPQFPDELETIQIPRREFTEFAARAKAEGISYVGGCCGCNAAYIRALAYGLENKE